MALITAIIRRSYARRVDVKTAEVVVRRAVVSPARIITRNRDGLSTLVDLDGTCPRRSSSLQTEAIGEVVLFPSSNIQQTGTTGAGASIFAGGLAWLERQEPKIMLRGQVTAVTYFGGGFTKNLKLVYMLPRKYWFDELVSEVHPGVLIGTLTILDESTAQADVAVDEDAQWGLNEQGQSQDDGPMEFDFG